MFLQLINYTGLHLLDKLFPSPNQTQEYEYTHLHWNLVEETVGCTPIIFHENSKVRISK
jgi:hypothetical protein